MRAWRPMHPARDGGGQAAFRQLHAVGAAGLRDVNAVVDQEQAAILRYRAHSHAEREQLGGGQVLLPELNHVRAAFNRLRNDLLQRLVAAKLAVA